MRNNDVVNLRREKLRNLLQQEMEEYQYEVYSNNGSQYLLDKFTSFNNYNNKNKLNDEENNLDYNSYNNNNNNIQFLNQNNININTDKINNIDSNNQYGQNLYMNNNDSLNRQKYMESEQQNDFINNNGNNNYNYGNFDLDTQINNYNSHYNKLRVDEFMSKKMIQDDLLNKINQKLMKINKDIDDKVYQENLAAQWRQNHQNQQ